MIKLSVLLTVVFVLAIAAGCAPPATPTISPTVPSPVAKAVEPTRPPAPVSAPSPTVAPTPTAGPKVKRGGTIIFARNNQVDNMDIVTSRTFSAPIATLVYEHLLNYEMLDMVAGKFELKPQLAEAWEMTEPAKISIKLKKGIKFSDGSDLNGDVVKWNLDRVRTNPKSEGKFLVSSLSGVDVVDASTIKVNLNAPSATALLKLSNAVSGTGAYATAMASKAAVDKGGPEALADVPVGTGPMVLEQWQRGDRVTLKKRDGYWQNGLDGQPLPYFDRFIDRYIPDSTVQLVELRTGSIQWASNIDLKDISTVKADRSMLYEEHPFTGSLRFVYTMSMNTGVFKDNQKLRQAMHYAINKEQMATTMGFGLAKPAWYIYWIPGVPGYDPTVNSYKYDPAKAKQLLTEAGYPNGIDFPLDVTARDPDRKIAEMAKFMWDAVGLRTEIMLLERAAAQARYRGGQTVVGIYTLAMLQDPDLFAPKTFTCDASANPAMYCSKQFDSCIAEGGTTLDEKKRDEIYKRCKRLFFDDAYFGTGYYEPHYTVYSSKMKGATLHYQDSDARWVWMEQ
jgi:peptide/nickel transport system substrate-binding protein